MKTRFIVNPRSGAAQRALPHVERFAAAHGAEIVRTERPRHASELAQRALADGCELIVAVGGALAPAMPQVVVPIARRVLREMVGHLIIDASDAKLGGAISAVVVTAASGTPLPIPFAITTMSGTTPKFSNPQ